MLIDVRDGQAQTAALHVRVDDRSQQRGAGDAVRHVRGPADGDDQAVHCAEVDHRYFSVNEQRLPARNEFVPVRHASRWSAVRAARARTALRRV